MPAKLQGVEQASSSYQSFTATKSISDLTIKDFNFLGLVSTGRVSTYHAKSRWAGVIKLARLQGIKQAGYSTFSLNIARSSSYQKCIDQHFRDLVTPGRASSNCARRMQAGATIPVGLQKVEQAALLDTLPQQGVLAVRDSQLQLCNKYTGQSCHASRAIQGGVYSS